MPRSVFINRLLAILKLLDKTEGAGEDSLVLCCLPFDNHVKSRSRSLKKYSQEAEEKNDRNSMKYAHFFLFGGGMVFSVGWHFFQHFQLRVQQGGRRYITFRQTSGSQPSYVGVL